MSDVPPVVREPLLSANLADGPTVERVQVARIELGPGQPSGRHFHPCDVVGHVVSGAIRFRIAGEDEIALAAGDAFFEPANREIAHFDNASASAAAVFIAFYLLPPGEERLIEMF